MRSIALSSLLLLPLVASCSSLMTAYKGRAQAKHGLLYKEKFEDGQVFVLTGDRRVAIALPERGTSVPDRTGPPGRLRRAKSINFCAEGMPDVAAVATASSEAKLTEGRADLAVADRVAAAATKTFERTENAELFRAWGFMACVASATRRFDDPAYAALFGQMTTAVAAVMRSNADRGAKPATAEAKPADAGLSAVKSVTETSQKTTVEKQPPAK